MKSTESIFVTTVPLPGGMSAYNQKTKRFVRWRKGYDQPAPASDVVPVPSFLFLNNKYIYWNDLGYYEMGLKESSDFRLKNKVKSKRSHSEVSQNSCKRNHNLVDNEFTPADLSSAPFCPWEMRRDKDIEESLSDAEKEKHFPTAQDSCSLYCLARSESSTSACSPPRNFPKRILAPGQARQPSASPFTPAEYPMQQRPANGNNMSGPYPANAPIVYSYSTQTVTHSVSVTHPPPPPPKKQYTPAPAPAPAPAPVAPVAPTSALTQAPIPTQQPESFASTEVALLPSTEDSAPWYVSHTPFSQRTFFAGDFVRVTTGTFTGCNGRVTGLAKAGNKVLQGQLKVKLELRDGQSCSVFVAVAFLEPRDTANEPIVEKVIKRTRYEADV